MVSQKLVDTIRQIKILSRTWPLSMTHTHTHTYTSRYIHSETPSQTQTSPQPQTLKVVDSVYNVWGTSGARQCTQATRHSEGHIDSFSIQVCSQSILGPFYHFLVYMINLMLHAPVQTTGVDTFSHLQYLNTFYCFYLLKKINKNSVTENKHCFMCSVFPLKKKRWGNIMSLWCTLNFKYEIKSDHGYFFKVRMAFWCSLFELCRLKYTRMCFRAVTLKLWQI